MIVTTESLLGNTVYGTPSGPYDGSSTNFLGDPVIAANYYAGLGSIQTATVVLANCVGVVGVQGTLQDDPAQAVWFDIDYTGSNSTPITGTYSLTMTGNFTYLRVSVTDFTAGEITSVILNY